MISGLGKEVCWADESLRFVIEISLWYDVYVGFVVRCLSGLHGFHVKREPGSDVCTG